MTIVLMVEGDTEAALRQHLKSFLDTKAIAQGRPRVRLDTRKGIVTSDPARLRRNVVRELQRPDVVAVVGLIDVYPDFANAAQAKAHLHQAVGGNPNFYAHAAQYDVEAWLLPFWQDICRKLKVKQSAPGGNPEKINGVNPPSARLKQLYQRAKPRRKYKKATEMYAILRGQDLVVIARQCPEFKSFLNTLLTLSNLEPIP